MDWNSSQYLKFKKERTQPSVDLANRICTKPAQKIIDIGCGPGNSTQILFEKFPEADIIGVDYSENMIEKARKNNPQLKFALFDACDDEWQLDNDYDIAFSNACLQWIPNHKATLKKIMGILKPGGIMAVQMPIQNEEPIHKIIGKLSKSKTWREKLNFESSSNVLSGNEYHDILSDMSDDFEIWTTTYYHRLGSYGDIIEWFKSTALKPCLDALSKYDSELFLNEVYDMLREYYTVQKNSQIILKFPRIFFTARKHK